MKRKPYPSAPSGAFANGKRMGARVVATDTEHDLAILELDTPVLDAPVLPAHVELEWG